MAEFPAGTIRITAVEPYGEDKVRITLDVLVDVHCMVEASSKMLSVATKGVARKKKQTSA